MKLAVEFPDYICMYESQEGFIDCVAHFSVEAVMKIFHDCKTATVVQIDRHGNRSILALKLNGQEV